jgi:LmbE family N-acetylglucosaminyl deacetylase
LNPTEIYYPDKYDRHLDHSATYEIVERVVSTMPVKPHKYSYIIESTNNNTEITQSYKVSINITENLPTKKKAIDQYKSQTLKLYASQPRPVLSAEFIERFEQPEEIFFSLD